MSSAEAQIGRGDLAPRKWGDTKTGHWVASGLTWHGPLIGQLGAMKPSHWLPESDQTSDRSNAICAMLISKNTKNIRLRDDPNMLQKLHQMSIKKSLWSNAAKCNNAAQQILSLFPAQSSKDSTLQISPQSSSSIHTNSSSVMLQPILFLHDTLHCIVTLKTNLNFKSLMLIWIKLTVTRGDSI